MFKKRDNKKTTQKRPLSHIYGLSDLFIEQIMGSYLSLVMCEIETMNLLYALIGINY